MALTDDASTLSVPLSRARVTTTSFRLRVSDGPDAGRVLELDARVGGRSSVGKSPVCELALTDPRVSRRHLALEVVDQRVRVADLGSTNGTRVNGVSVVEAWLDGGETISIGDTRLALDRLTPETSELVVVSSFGDLIGQSPAMRRLYPLCERLARSDVPIVIEGETGTGKEVLAESLHQASARKDKPFVVFDCTTVAPSLVEAALFGHEKGAFTGASSARQGVFEEAQGGTLLIDEIGDLEPALQPKLLRAIERAEVRRVGGTGFIRVDVRVIAATRRDLEQEIQAGRFRDDLYYRLAVAHLELPPLRHRVADIPLLTLHFWRMLGGTAESLPHDLVLRFEQYAWPGNVRELRNAVARRLALGDLAPEALSAPPRGSSGEPPNAGEDIVSRVLALDLPLSEARAMIVEEFQRRYVQRMLDRHGGTRRAAAAAGVAERYFRLLRSRRAP